jgi:hypothetical protein
MMVMVAYTGRTRLSLSTVFVSEYATMPLRMSTSNTSLEVTSCPSHIRMTMNATRRRHTLKLIIQDGEDSLISYLPQNTTTNAAIVPSIVFFESAQVFFPNSDPTTAAYTQYTHVSS